MRALSMYDDEHDESYSYRHGGSYGNDDIQNDDKELASNYDKHLENASFFIAYNKKKAELDKLLEDWEMVQEEIDNL